jgi:hypothetical protein
MLMKVKPAPPLLLVSEENQLHRVWNGPTRFDVAAHAHILLVRTGTVTYDGMHMPRDKLKRYEYTS